MALTYFTAAINELRELTGSLLEESEAPSSPLSSKRRGDSDHSLVYGKRARGAADGPPSRRGSSRLDVLAGIKDEDLEGLSNAPAPRAAKGPRAELVPAADACDVKTPSPTRRAVRTGGRRQRLTPVAALYEAPDAVARGGSEQHALAGLPRAESGSYAGSPDDDGTGAEAAEAASLEQDRCCNLCHIFKPLCEFYKVVNNYGKGCTKYATRCKDCIRTDAHRWFDKHRDAMMKVCDKCCELKCVGEYNMTINYTVFKYAYNHGGAWDRGLERYCRKCTYKHQKEAGIIARKQAKRRERAYGRQQVNVSEKRCSKCGETKAAVLFPKDKYMVDGLYIYCKPCTSAMKKKQKADRMAAQAQMTLTEKQCRKCQRTKGVDAFRKSPSNRDGRVNVCKDCQISAERERRGNGGPSSRGGEDDETGSEEYVPCSDDGHDSRHAAGSAAEDTVATLLASMGSLPPPDQ